MALNDRKKVPRLIEDYDKFLKETMALAVMDYPDIMAETNGTISPPHGSYRDTILYLYWHMPCRSFRRELIGSLAEEARFNLLRAALTASLGTDRAVEAAQPDFIPSRDHPWRDPFTARCLRSDRATSPTLIYSLGPDMTSQSGSDTFRFKTWNATHSVKSNLNLSMSGGRTGQEGASTSPMTWKDRVGVDIPEGDFSIRVGYQR
jgi:hypothetical protein